MFGSLVMRFANDFHSWLRHSWKLLENRLTRDPKIVIHGNSCIILYIHWLKPDPKPFGLNNYDAYDILYDMSLEM